MAFPKKKYNIIYSDPAWTFKVYSDKGKGRKFIGIDISKEYCKIARKRIRQESILSFDTKQEGVMKQFNGGEK